VKDEKLRIEFTLNTRRRRPLPEPEPVAKTERQRQDRATRRARNLALAHYIDSLVRSGAVEDLAAVARMCGVSRARVSQVVSLLSAITEGKDELRRVVHL
jgi:hypothetical protein